MLAHKSGIIGLPLRLLAPKPMTASCGCAGRMKSR